MTKISLSQLQDVLAEAKIAPDKQKEILDSIKAIVEEEKAEKETPTKTKNEFGIVIFDKENELAGKEFSGCVYQIKEGDNHSTVLLRISESVRSQNESSKKKKNLIKTMGEAFQSLKRKFIKDKGINIKTKNPVRVLISNNSL